MKHSRTVTMPLPQSTFAANASQASVGAPIQPLRRLQMMEPVEWEEFILEWVDSLRPAYIDVQRCGGPGDMGRDIIAVKAQRAAHQVWDNYQCKHYKNALSIADVVAEIGKLLYHASQGEFSLPDHYFFVAPKGPGTALLKCLGNGTLKQELISRWDRECRTSVIQNHPIELASVQATIDAFDFAVVTVLSPLAIIAGHQKTRYYTFRFGGGLPTRPMPIPAPPTTFQATENVYIKKLLDAYVEDRNKPFSCVADLQSGAPDLAKHLQRSREQFFSAESLRAFSRDNVHPGTYEGLQDEVLDGIQEVYEDPTHKSGYERVIRTINQARLLPITGNPLIGVLLTNDRAGICHQLANDDRITWVHRRKHVTPQAALEDKSA